MRYRSQAIRSQSTSLLITDFIASIKPIPTWADKALSAKEVELLEAVKAKDSYRIKNARRGIDSLRVKVGLEGHNNVDKRV